MAAIFALLLALFGGFYGPTHSHGTGTPGAVHNFDTAGGLPIG